MPKITLSSARRLLAYLVVYLKQGQVDGIKLTSILREWEWRLMQSQSSNGHLSIPKP